jgi:hypothetical protein
MLCRLETRDPPSRGFGGLSPRLLCFGGLAAEMKRKTNENALLEIFPAFVFLKLGAVLIADSLLEMAVQNAAGENAKSQGQSGVAAMRIRFAALCSALRFVANYLPAIGLSSDPLRSSSRRTSPFVHRSELRAHVGAGPVSGRHTNNYSGYFDYLAFYHVHRICQVLLEHS